MAVKKPQPDLCVLSVSYVHLLLPAEQGLKVAQLLRGSVEVKHCMEHRQADWEIEGTLRVNYETTEPGRIRQKPSETDAPNGPLAITVEPLKLTLSRGAR